MNANVNHLSLGKKKPTKFIFFFLKERFFFQIFFLRKQSSNFFFRPFEAKFCGEFHFQFAQENAFIFFMFCRTLNIVAVTLSNLLFFHLSFLHCNLFVSLTNSYLNLFCSMVFSKLLILLRKEFNLKSTISIKLF